MKETHHHVMTSPRLILGNSRLEAIPFSHSPSPSPTSSSSSSPRSLETSSSLTPTPTSPLTTPWTTTVPFTNRTLAVVETIDEIEDAVERMMKIVETEVLLEASSTPHCATQTSAVIKLDEDESEDEEEEDDDDESEVDFTSTEDDGTTTEEEEENRSGSNIHYVSSAPIPLEEKRKQLLESVGQASINLRSALMVPSKSLPIQSRLPPPSSSSSPSSASSSSSHPPSGTSSDSPSTSLSPSPSPSPPSSFLLNMNNNNNNNGSNDGNTNRHGRSVTVGGKWNAQYQPSSKIQGPLPSPTVPNAHRESPISDLNLGKSRVAAGARSALNSPTFDFATRKATLQSNLKLHSSPSPPLDLKANAKTEKKQKKRRQYQTEKKKKQNSIKGSSAKDHPPLQRGATAPVPSTTASSPLSVSGFSSSSVIPIGERKARPTQWRGLGLVAGVPQGLSDLISTDTPEFYVALLRRKTVLAATLAELSDKLLSDSDWLKSFVDLEGVYVLLLTLAGLYEKPALTNSELGSLSSILQSIRILFNNNYALSSLLMNQMDPSPSINTLACGLLHEHIQIAMHTIQLLWEVCSLNNIGQPTLGLSSVIGASTAGGRKDGGLNGVQLVWEALKNLQTKTKENDRLFPLVRYLSSEAPIDSKTVCMSIINLLINHSDDVEKRWALRMSIQNLGLQAIFQQLKASSSNTDNNSIAINEGMQIQMDIFEEGMTDDHSLLSAHRRRTLSHRPISLNLTEEEGEEESGPAFPLGFAVQHISSKRFLRIFCKYEEKVGTSLIPYESTTLVREVHACLSIKYPLRASAEYGLFVVCTDLHPNGCWLQEDRTVFSYSIDAETTVEWKPKPWKVFLQPPVGKGLNTYLDPAMKCGAIVSLLYQKLNLPSSEEFGLYVHYLDVASPSAATATSGLNGESPTTTGEWMDDAVLLSSYELDRRKCSLELKEKPRCFKVKFNDETFDNVYIDHLSCTTQTLISMIGNKRGLPEKDLSSGNYGLFYNDEQRGSFWLAEDRKIGTYGFGDGVTVLFQARPVSVSIVLPSKEVIVEELFLDEKPSDVLDKLSKRLSVNSSTFSLGVANQDDNKVTILWPWGSLREQGVTGLTQLVVTEREKEIEQLNSSEGKVWDHPAEELQDFCTLNRLIIELTPEKEIDMPFVRVFFWTYRSFTTPELLLSKLIERYNVPPRVDPTAKVLVQLRVCTALKHWIEIEHEELEASTVAKITRFIESIDENDDPRVSGLVSRLKKRIATTQHRQQGEEARKFCFLEQPPEPKLPKNLSRSLRLEDIDETEAARQLTLLTFNAFSKVKPMEMIRNMKQNNSITFLVELFNGISVWVASSIVLETTLRARAKLLQKHIGIAQKLRELNNFHLLTAYISGICNSAVSRLKWTKSKLPKRAQQILNELVELTAMEGSFKNYRAALAKAVPPCVPYLGVYLMDLTFIEDGNPSFVAGGLINFGKRRLVYNVVESIKKFQSVAYNLRLVDEISIFFNLSGLRRLDDKELYQHSLRIEPRNAERSDIL